MSLPRRLEQVGIVVGSVLMLSLPLTVFTPFLVESPQLWQTTLLVYLPSFVVGTLIALGKFPVSYQQVWAFGIVSWLSTVALWMIFDVQSVTADQQTAIGTWLVALLVGALVAWANPRIRPRGSEA
ncbi:hypothetical protein SAMN05421858_2647 [Haladaptatus litoreus]|uniref:Uncharacterized protein n=1 Tax=Haladaptatus litoreus TaxID=553468 RepID=A0A1N7BN77_9EURY|nr:hypothetical protein [Haladaptatus litoreus]SIR52614.1 hypothetical protein SAMN05421858_2647 [Haladaptatus litoreus]